MITQQIGKIKINGEFYPCLIRYSKYNCTMKRAKGDNTNDLTELTSEGEFIKMNNLQEKFLAGKQIKG